MLFISSKLVYINFGRLASLKCRIKYMIKRVLEKCKNTILGHFQLCMEFIQVIYTLDTNCVPNTANINILV